MYRFCLVALILTVTCLRQVLAEPQANNSSSAESNRRANPTGIRSADGSKIYVGQFRPMGFQDTELTNVFRIFAEISNLNIVLMESLEGKVTLTFDHWDWERALQTVLEMHQLAKIQQGNVIKIYKKSNPVFVRPLSPKAYSGKLISLDLRKTSLDNALTLIEEAGKIRLGGKEKFSSVVEPTLRLIDVPWDQCLDILLEKMDARSERRGNQYILVREER